MAITVQKLKTPNITLTGRIVHLASGKVAAANSTYTGGNTDVRVSGNVVTNSSEVVFRDGVILRFVPKYPQYSYNPNSPEDENETKMVNESVSKGSKVGQNSETWYTINGKDPVRTKSYLWQGKDIVLQHSKGTNDTMIIKAKTYYLGQVSDIASLEVRILRKNSNIV